MCQQDKPNADITKKGLPPSYLAGTITFFISDIHQNIFTKVKFEDSIFMKNRVFVWVWVLLGLSLPAFGQSYEYEAPEIRLRTGLPTVFTVESVRQITGSDEESVLNIGISIKKGKIESVSRDAGTWVVTIRTSSKEASTYLIKDSQFKIMGEESKKVMVNAIHWKDGN